MRATSPRTWMWTLAAVAFLAAHGLGSDTLRASDAPPVAESATHDDDPAAEQISVPDWMQVDRDASTVTMEIVAGLTNASNYWNFNGFTSGEATVVVPEGFEVEITLRNDDPNMAHSLGIDETRQTWPAMMPNPEPVFEGAMTSNPTSMGESTMPGESETITFTADQAGRYAMVCYVPGHATVGMWIYFEVSAEGEAGLRTSG